jgi:hypothetical protein
VPTIPLLKRYKFVEKKMREIERENLNEPTRGGFFGTLTIKVTVDSFENRELFTF